MRDVETSIEYKFSSGWRKYGIKESVEGFVVANLMNPKKLQIKEEHKRLKKENEKDSHDLMAHINGAKL